MSVEDFDKLELETKGAFLLNESKDDARFQKENHKDAKTTVTALDLMAPSFVPKIFRETFVHLRSIFWPTQELPNSLDDMQRLYFSAVKVTAPFNDEEFPWMNQPAIVWNPLFVHTPEGEQRLSPTFQKTFPDIETQIASLDEYVEAFRSMLYEEFCETTMLYERYAQYNKKLVTKFEQSKENENDYVSRAIIEIPGIHDARPPLRPGDRVLLRPMDVKDNWLEGLEIFARVITTIRAVKNGKKDKVVITWLPSNHRKLVLQCTFAIRFFPASFSFDRSATALEWLQKRVSKKVAKDLLFPTHHPEIQGINLDLNDPDIQPLNQEQRQFVRIVLSRTAAPSTDAIRPPVILTGPAGTGKTRTLLTALLKCLKNPKDTDGTLRRVLVCTPSHTACDVITRRLAKHLESHRLYRLYDKSRPVETVPVEMFEFTRQDSAGFFKLPTIQDFLKFQVVICTCTDAYLLYTSGMTNKSLRIRRQRLLSTVKDMLKFSNISHTIGDGALEPYFTHLFIDEAAQASEPESLIPLSVVVDDELNVPKVEIALSGDPRQLNSDIYSPFASPGLQKSFVERLLRLPDFGGRKHLLGPPTKDSWRTMDELIEYSFQNKQAGGDDRYLATFLTLSYRGHPSFLHMPSKLFYLNKLKSFYPEDLEDAGWCRAVRKIESQSTLAYPCDDKKYGWPIHFLGVKGSDISLAVEAFWGSNSNSWCNRLEAEKVAEIVVSLRTTGISTSSIGVMAAFRAQVLLIRRFLRERNLESINVGMVEDYQAVEKQVIILSLTRSNEAFVPSDVKRNSGLFQQPKRVNVGLTRAESMLVIVGNPTTMSKDPLWAEYLSFCRKNGLWYGDHG